MDFRNALDRTLATSSSAAAIPVRLTLGLIMAAHGAQKLFGWFDGYGLAGTAGWFESALGMSPGILWATLAGSTEFFGGLLVIAGLGTRLAAAGIAVTMLVAIVLVHAGAFFLPAGLEYPLALLGAALGLVISGGGRLSVDAALRSGEEDRSEARERTVSEAA